MADDKKKGVFSKLFGSKKSSCCNLKIEEITDEQAKPKEAPESSTENPGENPGTRTDYGKMDNLFQRTRDRV
jgi:hypothetical protein